MDNYELKEWLQGIIRSCETKEQIKSAERLVRNYERCGAHKSEVEIMDIFLSNQEVLLSL